MRKTKGDVLIFAPIAVAAQFVREGEKFGIKVNRTWNGEVSKGINVVNYHRIDKYRPEDFAGVVADESGCIKHSDSQTRKKVTTFLSKIPYRLLCTATPAPNDFMELGTSAEALGAMTRNQMLGMFFTNDGESTQQWRIKGHAKQRFWQWVAQWARACRKPSDLGFSDGDFKLPPLDVEMVTVKSETREGLFPKLASTLNEQRQEKRATIEARCEAVAENLPKNRPCVCWCQLNSEGDLLEKMIPGAVQVAGRHDDELKEERLNAFSLGQIRVLISKPTIAGWGLNWQHCSDVSYFPSWSHEAYYQAVRRCWRFGQKRRVKVRLVHSEAERKVVSGMLRKERQSEELFSGIIREMGAVLQGQKVESNGDFRVKVPEWLR